MSSHHVAIDDAAWASPWRRRRVGEKAVLSLGLVLTALLSPPWPGCVLVGLASLVFMLAMARIHVHLVAMVITAPMVFLAIGTLPVVAQWRGAMAWGPVQQGFGVGPFLITGSGLAQAGALWAHSLAGTLAVVLLATTTPMVDLLTWLRRFRIPDALLEIASLTYRLLFLLLGTSLALAEAQRARLGDAAGWRRRLSTTAQTTATILVSTWQRAARMQEGLAGRGFEESLHTLAPVRTPSPLMMGSTLTVLAGIWLANWGWLAWT